MRTNQEAIEFVHRVREAVGLPVVAMSISPEQAWRDTVRFINAIDPAPCSEPEEVSVAKYQDEVS